jgi:DNA repair exonuclease SbcCD ATPase subunit
METERKYITNSPAVKSYQAAHGLRNLKEILGLVEAALVMSLEGTSRATVSEVLKRATEEFGVISTAAVSGQIFSQLKISTATTHGKPRLVLDTTQLKSIKDQLSRCITEVSKELADVLSEYKDTGNRIKQLEEQLKESIQLYKRERELTQQLQQVNSQPSRVPYLEQELVRRNKDAEQVTQLEVRCKELSKKIKTLPSLQDKEKKLATDISNYQAWEREIVQSEGRLGTALEQLKMRSAWATVLDLHNTIQKQKVELDDLSRQLGEKKSLLQRILGGRGK